jgi:hypothetical protein
MYFDRAGNELDLIAWAELRRDTGYCRIGETLTHEVRVSTIWIGINMGLMLTGDSRPAGLFETMTFSDVHEMWDHQQWRYSTEAEATAGHEEVVQSVNASFAFLN